MQSVHAVSTDLNPDKAQELLDISSGKSPEVIREMEQSVRSILENEMQATLHYLTFQGAVLLGKSYSVIRSLFGIGASQRLKYLRRASGVIAAMEPAQAQLLNARFKSWGVEGSMQYYFEKWTKDNKSSSGRSVWESLNDGNAKQRISLILPGQMDGSNFTSITLLATLINLKLYPSSMTDSEMARAFMAALEIEKKEAESLSANQNQEPFKRFFNHDYATVREKTFKDKAFTAYFKKHLEEQESIQDGSSTGEILIQDISSLTVNGGTETAVQRAGGIISINGPKMSKFSMIANLRRILMKNKSIQMKWAFSLGQFSGNFIRGSMLSVVAETLVESAIVVAAGQRKEKIKLGDEKAAYDTQKTTRQSGANWLDEFRNDRKFAFLDLADDVADNWEARAAGLVGGVAVATLLGTSLPLTIAAAAVGYAAYSGVKALTSMDWYQNWKHSGLIQDLQIMIKKMPHATKDLHFNDQQIEETAQLRAKEMIKRKENGKQSPQRIYFVDRLSSLQYQKRGNYWFMLNDKEEFGRKFDVEAHARYDILDISGSQGVWDVKNPMGIHNVGHLEKTNGLDVTLINSDNTFDFQDGGKTLHSPKGSNFRVLSNGSIWARDEEQKEKWIVRGLTFNTDVVIRESKGRFTYDEGNGKHIFVDETGHIPPRERDDQGGVNPPNSGVENTQIQRSSPAESPAASARADKSQNEVLEDAFLINP